ncbi:MAG TPA: hypothetical protein VHB98_02865, partial [Chloroflexota bacterium]|nr:hypothetical protein [Chloroflexota bacterium]
LGRTYRGHGRLYLVGGTQMVYRGFRAQTQDVDYVVQLDTADDQDFVSLRKISGESSRRSWRW